MTFKSAMTPVSTLRFICGHPISSKRPISAIARYFGWQLRSRMFKGPHPVRFFNNSKLWVSRGMTGASGNIYCGLHEFEMMAFAIHYARPGDLFCDIGSNIGSYSVMLASLGVHCRAYEPIESTHKHLLNNIRMNSFEGLVEVFRCAVSDRSGKITMTIDRDTTNHVMEDPAHSSEDCAQVTCVTLDEDIQDRVPALIKIDTEGHESAVIQGALKTLTSTDRMALIVEVNKQDTHEILKKLNFTAFDYDPFSRRLKACPAENTVHGNKIYLKNMEYVQARITAAPVQKIHGVSF